MNGLSLRSPALVARVTPAGGGPSYLLNEQFEAAPGYDEAGWTETGTPDENHTGTVLKGAQSLYISGGSYPQHNFTGQTTVETHGRIWFNQFNTNTTIQIGNVGETTLVGLRIEDAGATVKLNVNGGLTAASATSLSTGVIWYYWMRYVSGGTCELAMSTTTTRPTADGSGNIYLTGTGAADTATVLLLYAGGGSAIFILDNILVSASPIGNNP